MSDKRDYYEILGVPGDASPEAIKHAYFTLVRRFRPSEHPETFQAMNEAYRCLSDPNQRQEYDLRRRFGSQVQTFIDQAAAVSDRDPQKALWLLGHARELAPDIPQTRLLLASQQMQLGRYAEAEVELKWLAARFPHDAKIRFQLGRCYWAQERPFDAEPPLSAAVQLNPHFYDALVLLAQVYLALKRLEPAETTLERAIALDGVENHADLDALVLLVAVHAIEGDFLKLERSAQRIDAVIPDDPARINGAMARLYARARELARTGNAGAACEVLRHAHHPRLSDPDLLSAIEEFQARLPLLCEAQAMAKDERILPALRDFLIAGCRETEDESPHYAVLERRVDGEVERNTAAVLRGVEHVFLEYPDIAAHRGTYLRRLRDRAISVPSRAGDSPLARVGAPSRSEEGGFFRRLKRLVGQ